MVLEELLSEVDTKEAELRGILYEEDGKSERAELTEEQESRVAELRGEIKDLDKRIKDEKRAAERIKIRAEARKLVTSAATETRDGTDAKVENEPMVYGEGSPHSYFRDYIVTSAGRMWGQVDPDAERRMAEWSHQAERELAHGSKFGAHAEAQATNHVRTENGQEARSLVKELRDRGRTALESKVEQRAITTGGGATASAAGGGGAAFVTPWFDTDYAPWREPGRAFANVCNSRGLPPYGLNVYLPAVTGPAAVASQTEGAGVTETDPTLGFISAGLIIEAGEVTVTQQLLDRAGPGYDFDQIMFDQLRRDYNPKVDTYCITQALANAGQVTWQTGSFALTAAAGTSSLATKVAGAINAIETTSGTIQSPSHVFMVPSRWNLIEATPDSQNRPLVVPNIAGAFNAIIAGNASGQVDYEGDTGYKLFGLPVFKDLNIPAPASGNDQVIVANTKQVYLYEGPQVPRVIPQTLAQNLQVILQLYAYVGVIVRYSKAVQSVLGATLVAPAF